jgi:hypothetical protein
MNIPNSTNTFLLIKKAKKTQATRQTVGSKDYKTIVHYSKTRSCKGMPCFHHPQGHQMPGTKLYSPFETRPPFCSVVHFVYILMDPDPNWKACHQQIRLATNIKFAGVNIYGHPNIWCEDQHRLTTKNFFYLCLELIDNFIDLAEEITIRLLWKNFTLKLFGSRTTRIVISIQLQIKYIWQIKVHVEIFLYLTLTLMNMQWWSCLYWWANAALKWPKS